LGHLWAYYRGGLIIMLGTTMHEKTDKPLHLPVQGAENTPILMAFLKQQDVILE
jgi:hypothetical protein